MKNKINMYGFVCLVLWIFFSAINSYGAYLRNFPVTVTQPDGEELQLFASGDEYYNWLHDKDGYTIIQDPDSGFYMYAVMRKENLIPSIFRVNGPDKPGDLNIPPYLKLPPERILSRADLALVSEGPANAPKTGSINNIVIFIRFSGESEFTDLLSTYSNMFNNTGAGVNSMRNYFTEVSYNQLTINTTFYPIATTTVVSYQDSHNRAYFQPYNSVTNPTGYTGGNNGTERTTREHTLLKNAVDAVSSQVPSGLVTDGDGDGNVDNVCFIISGGPTGWASLLWPHQWSLYSQTAYINGKRVYTFNFQLRDSLMSSGVGVLCHEMFHSLGSPDLYHYSYDGLTPVGYWDIMQYDTNPPQHMSSYMKYRYGGWIASLPEITTPGTYSLNPLTSSSNNCYKIPSPNSTNEFFVVEYRKKTGSFENSLPGEGLLVFRINSAATGNANGPPDEVYVYRPDGTLTVDGDYNLANFSSNTGRTAINDSTNPSSFFSDNSAGGLNISGVGSTGSTISFTVSLPAFLSIEDAVDNNNLTFSTGGNASWVGQTSISYYDGDAAKSGGITHSQNTWVQSAVTGPATLKFYWKVSSEPSWDLLNFYIDDVKQEGISGLVDWTQKTYNIAAGSHTIKWTYEKDGSVSTNSDCGWIDKVEYTPSSSITVTSPNGGEVWKLGSNHAITWKSSGLTGTLTISLWQNSSKIGDIATDVSNSLNSYSWTVGTVIERTASAGSGYQIKVEEPSTSTADTSNSSFTIINPSITVSSPNGGEFWMTGSSQNITWQSSGLTGTLTISLYRNSSKIGDIATGVSNTLNSYSWTAGNYTGGTAPAGSGYQIKVEEPSTATSDLSNAVFTTLPIPSITVVSPNGAEEWNMGAGKVISWNNSHVSGTQKITLWQNGSLIGVIVDSVSASKRSYKWASVGVYIGGTASAGSGYKIKVEENGSSASDMSDASFTILANAPTPQLTIKSPNGGESWLGGTSQPITWSSIGSIANVKIEFSSDNGTGWTTIIENAPNSGTYPWFIQSPASTVYLVKISDASNAAVYDVSNSIFEVTSAKNISLTSPNGGEVWTKGSAYSITWTASGLSTPFKITLWKDGNLVDTIAKTIPPTTRSFSWKAGDLRNGRLFTPGQGFQIKIEVEKPGGGSDISDTTFTIN